MQTFSTNAIILDRQNFRENDLRVIIYSKEKGKLELVAKGAKKNTSKIAAHIEPLNLVNTMIVAGKQFDYIGSAVSRNCFTSIKNNFDKVNMACDGIRTFNKLIKTEYADKKIFYLLKDFLFFLNSYHNDSQINIIFSCFKLKLISLLGYKPELYNCVHCESKIMPNNNKFSLDMGGTLCSNDISHSKNYLNISDNCIKFLRAIINFNFNEIIKIKINNQLKKESDLVINSALKYL